MECRPSNLRRNITRHILHAACLYIWCICILGAVHQQVRIRVTLTYFPRSHASEIYIYRSSAQHMRVLHASHDLYLVHRCRAGGYWTSSKMGDIDLFLMVIYTVSEAFVINCLHFFHLRYGANGLNTVFDSDIFHLPAAHAAKPRANHA